LHHRQREGRRPDDPDTADEPAPAKPGRVRVARGIAGLDQSLLLEAIERDQHEVLIRHVAQLSAQDPDQIVDGVLAVGPPPHECGGCIEAAGDVAVLVVDEQLVIELFG
jgi:hypothetical protein